MTRARNVPHVEGNGRVAITARNVWKSSPMQGALSKGEHMSGKLLRKPGFYLSLACLVLLLALNARPAEAQSIQYVGPTCTISWTPNAESDLAGYRAFAVRGATQNPVLTIPKTATSHVTNTTCAAVGITTDGAWTFNLVAFDLAGNASAPAVVNVTRDTVAPATPGGISIASPQPIALSVTPNPEARQATVAWVPGTCRSEFIVSRLVSGRWIEVGRTRDTWMDVPLINQVNQPYGVSAVCEG